MKYSPRHSESDACGSGALWRAASLLLMLAVVALALMHGILEQAGSMYLTQTSAAVSCVGASNSTQAGELEFVSYTSSKLEEEFLEKLPQMEVLDEYCNFVATYEKQIVRWLTAVKESKTTGSMFFDDSEAQDVLSVFEFRYRCDQGDGYCTYKTMIEPLAFFLRHPAARCFSSFPDQSMLLPDKGNGLMDHSYVFYATKEQTQFGPHEHTHLDLGAQVKPDQVETHLLIRTYEDQGVEFNRMLLWEAKQETGETIFQTVPERWYNAYQYFNVPVDVNISSEAHPLQVLKRVHPGTGFVAFKLDIDHGDIENAIAEKLIAWHDQFPSIKAGQFEFFFEQHVDVGLMRQYWGASIDDEKTLVDSYQLFLNMRKLGIRSHGWI